MCDDLAVHDSMIRAIEAVDATPIVRLLAHEGGWDEALMVLAPLAIVGLILVAANRRATRALDAKLSQQLPPEAPVVSDADPTTHHEPRTDTE